MKQIFPKEDRTLKKRFAKFLALALVLVMVLSAIPFSAIAQGFVNDGNETTAIGDLWSKLRGGLNDFFRPRPTTPPTTDGRSFTGVTESGLTVNVDAPAGAFMNGTTMTVREVANMQAVQDAVDNTDGVSGTVLAAVDITFMLRGREVQPTKDITVSITSDALASVSNPSVVHIDASADELGGEEDADLVANVKSGNSTVTFEADSFSIYAVIDDGQEGDLARLEINFYKPSYSEGQMSYELVATVYVKNSDQLLGDGERVETVQYIEDIVYDPGVGGTLGDGLLFGGWTIDSADANPTGSTNYGKNYDVDTTVYTIPGICKYLAQKKVGHIAEGDKLDIYALIYKVFDVTYKDSHDIVLASDIVMMPLNATSGSFTIKETYKPNDQITNFEGWQVAEGASNISNASKPAPYPQGTTMDLSGDVVFSTVLVSGHWLVYEENGYGATYNAPAFIKSNELTHAPALEMTRPGYTFGGWYTDAACTAGNEYPFNLPLEDRLTVYAKWTMATTADYTVIIWKENIDCDGYDYVGSISMNGTTQSPISPITKVNDTTARVNGTSYSYTGFEVGDYDSNVTIKPAGGSVLNVYFDRIEYTLTFKVTNIAYTYNGSGYVDAPVGTTAVTNSSNINTLNSNQRTISGYQVSYYGSNYYNRTYCVKVGSSWYPITSRGYNVYNASNITAVPVPGNPVVKTITAAFEQDISAEFPIVAENGVIYPTGTRWNPDSGLTVDGTTYFTHDVVVAFIDKMTPGDMEFEISDPGSRTEKTMVYWVETINNTPTEGKATKTYKGVLYEEYKTVRAHYTGVTIEDYIELNGFSHLEADQSLGYTSNGTTYYGTSSGAATEVNFYYTRNQYSIIYFDGVYYNRDGIMTEDMPEDQGELHVDSSIYFNADISSYGEGGVHYYTPTCPPGFIFDGWYLNKECSDGAEADFDKMPLGGMKVYAKWRLIEYRVFLKPNALLNGTRDNTLDWGKDDQATNFRIDYNKKVSCPTGLRYGFEFGGWYTDPDFNYMFDDSTKLTDSTVPETPVYDKTTDFTDGAGNVEMDKWGLIPDGATPINKDVDRYWITRKLNLYARWSKIIPGASGVGLIYNANGGTNAPDDTRLYKDNVKAIAQAASTAPNTNQQFLYWVVQKYDTATGTYVDAMKSDAGDLDEGEEDGLLIVYPGERFSVLLDLAKQEPRLDDNGQQMIDYTDPEHPQPLWVYTVELKAMYGPKAAPTPTHISWFSGLYDIDGGSFELDSVTHPGTAIQANATTGGIGWVITNPNLQINQAVDIMAADTYSIPGYKFIGWARINNETGYPGNNDPTSITMDDMFLEYRDGKFYAKANSRDTEFTVEVTKVAADEAHSYHDLYAMWVPEYFYVFHSSTGKLEAIKMPHSLSETCNLVAKVPSTHLYGGYYKTYGGVTLENIEAAKSGAKSATTHEIEVTGAVPYDGTNLKNGTTRFWTKADAYGMISGETTGSALRPTAETVYYLKEVPKKYLGVHARWIYNWYYDNRIDNLYLLTVVDDLNYTSVGYTVASDDEIARLVSSFTFVPTASNTGANAKRVKITANDLIGQRGYLGVVDATEYIESIVASGTEGIQLNPFWVTIDGVEVNNVYYTFGCSGGDTLTTENFTHVVCNP